MLTTKIYVKSGLIKNQLTQYANKPQQIKEEH